MKIELFFNVIICGLNFEFVVKTWPTTLAGVGARVAPLFCKAKTFPRSIKITYKILKDCLFFVSPGGFLGLFRSI